ncbi:MAG TPA: hypothetical protein VFH58_03995 [Acidimicrobiales bacterium]|nr:hypothetical protein [Acidimicrobiales bacterium]
MATRQQVLELIRSGDSVEAVARRLGIPAGKAYMIATGIPADSSDTLVPADFDREAFRRGGTQDLLGVPHKNPNRPEEKPEVMEWVRRRAEAQAGTGGGR